MLDSRISNGKVFVPGSGFFNVDLGIKDGKVVTIGSPDDMPDADEVLDAGKKIVMPGVIDPHIHLGIFGDFAMECENETRAALAGGVTTVGVFMGGGESYLPQLGSLIDIVEQKSSVDLMFHLSIFTEEQMAQMEDCYEQFGVTSFKFYMAGVKGVFPGVTDGFIFEGFKRVAAMGDRALACIHCEDQSLIDVAFEKVSAETPDGTLSDWANTGPDMAEEEAIMRAYYLAEKARNRLYIVHISTGDGASRFKLLKKSDYRNVYGETTSAYLTVNKNGSFGMLGKMLPPLRDQTDNEALWERVKDGTIDTFGTDNVSMTKEVKQAEGGMLGAMPGYPILQTHLSAILTEGYHKRGVSLDKILTRATRNPAEIFGLYPQKGTIAIGSDADIVVLDLEKEWVVKSDELFSYGDFSLYEGKTLKGKPSVVIKNGKKAYEDDKILVAPGAGAYLRRTL